MQEKKSSKTIGQAIDAVIDALRDLDEPSKSIAIKAACEHLNISLDLEQKVRGQIPEEAEPSRAYARQQRVELLDIRSLTEEKSPSSAIEMACIVAFYLENYAPGDERRDTITPSDITKYFKQAPFKLPKYPSQVLVDAKAAGYFDSAGRGAYKLNPVGYNLVAHSLPRGNKGGGQKAKRKKRKPSRK